MTLEELKDKINHADAYARADLRLTESGDAVLSVSMGDLQRLIGDADGDVNEAAEAVTASYGGTE